MRHDINTVTGEEVVHFIMADSPICRDVKKR